MALTIVSKNRLEADFKEANEIVAKRPAGLGLDYEKQIMKGLQFDDIQLPLPNR